MRLGYPARAAERELLLSGGVERELEELAGRGLRRRGARRCSSGCSASRSPRSSPTTCSALAEATRKSDEFQLGVSTRGALGLFRAAQALALFEGRDFAVPDDVQRLAPAVLAHRVVLRRGSTGLEAARRAVEVLVHGTPLPI